MGAGPDGTGPGSPGRLLTPDEVLNLPAEGALLLPRRAGRSWRARCGITPTGNLRVCSNRPLPERNPADPASRQCKGLPERTACGVPAFSLFLRLSSATSRAKPAVVSCQRVTASIYISPAMASERNIPAAGRYPCEESSGSEGCSGRANIVIPSDRPLLPKPASMVVSLKSLSSL